MSSTTTGQILPWQPEKVLAKKESNQARFSRGFLRADFLQWIASINQQWLSLFNTIGVKVELIELRTNLSFLEELDRTVVIEANAEPAILGLDRKSIQTLVAELVSDSCDNLKGELVIEYLGRRLLSSLSRSWSGSLPLHFQYLHFDTSTNVEIVGVVTVSLSFNKKPVNLWFGFGPRVTEFLDSLWRTYILRQLLPPVDETNVGQDHLITVQIGELAVPPAVLIDYIRSGSIINLEIPVSDTVIIKLNGESWARGSLCQFNGRFAVEILDFNPVPNEVKPATTRVEVEIARLSLEHSTLKEHEQVGAILVTPTTLGSTAAMVISGEQVAMATICQIDNHFALNVLPRTASRDSV